MENYSYFLDGDLSQMSIQRRFLNERGIRTEQRNVYPCLRPSDVKQALTLIWENHVEGWWNYRDKIIELEICTEENFYNRLKRC